jgi:hypothetical protein
MISRPIFGMNGLISSSVAQVHTGAFQLRESSSYLRRMKKNGHPRMPVGKTDMKHYHRVSTIFLVVVLIPAVSL